METRWLEFYLHLCYAWYFYQHFGYSFLENTSISCMETFVCECDRESYTICESFTNFCLWMIPYSEEILISIYERFVVVHEPESCPMYHIDISTSNLFFFLNDKIPVYIHDHFHSGYDLLRILFIWYFDTLHLCNFLSWMGPTIVLLRIIHISQWEKDIGSDLWSIRRFSFNCVSNK